MALSQVGVCNLACIEVGAARISSIDQDIKQAILLKALWEPKLRSFLRNHRWNFATKRAELAPTGTAPDFGYDYAYDFPNDLVRVLDPDPEENSDDFVVEGRQILSNDDTLDMIYVWYNDDPSSWDASFARAFALDLAGSIAYAMTQSATLRDQLQKAAAEALREARTVDGQEGKAPEVEISTFTNARR